MSKMGMSEFVQELNSLGKAYSIQGQLYHSIYVSGNKVRFTRQGKETSETIKLEELFELYRKSNEPLYADAKKYISGRVQSPSVAIVRALQQSGTTRPTSREKPRAKSTKASSATKDHEVDAKDETRFFLVLAELVGEEYLRSKSIGKAIASNQVFLSKNFLDFQYNSTIEDSFSQIIAKLNSNGKLKSLSLSHNIDGLLMNHPSLGSRIVEFDEEQHFSPALKFVLQEQSKVFQHPYQAYYLAVCDDLEYLNTKVLPKHRVKKRFAEFPVSFNSFANDLADEAVSNYIKVIPEGFPFKGGRIAQRAYYDGLRNAAHLSFNNSGMEAPLRFPKKFFEDKYGLAFSSLNKEQIEEGIRTCLLEWYGLSI